MMSPGGWVKIHRSLSSSSIWTCEKFSRGQAWVDLIILATHNNSYFYRRGNKIELKRGQVGISIAGLADRWKWSQGKVQRFIKDLENEEQIEQQKSYIGQVLTIKNYEKFQGNGEQTGSRRGADGDNQECKEGKECKEIIDHLNFVSGKKYKSSTPKTRSAINARLNEGFSPEDCKKVIDIKCAEWLNTDRAKFIRPETLFGTKFEGYLNQVPEPKTQIKKCEECTYHLNAHQKCWEEGRVDCGSWKPK